MNQITYIENFRLATLAFIFHSIIIFTNILTQNLRYFDFKNLFDMIFYCDVGHVIDELHFFYLMMQFLELETTFIQIFQINWHINI